MPWYHNKASNFCFYLLKDGNRYLFKVANIFPWFVGYPGIWLVMFSPRLCLNLLKLERSSCFCLPSPAVNFWDIVLRQEIQHWRWVQTIDSVDTYFYRNQKKKKQQHNFLTYSALILTDLYLLELLNGFQSQAHSLTQVSIQVLLRQWFYLKT